MHMGKYNRIFVVVIDSLGVGAMPDAERFGDVGSNTLKHISESVKVSVSRICKGWVLQILPL